MTQPNSTALMFVLLFVVVAMTACGGGGGPRGTVVGKGFSPAHEDPCKDWAKVCFHGHYGERYYLELMDHHHSSDSWIVVSPSDFPRYKVGDSYP